jgi:hypothetical protein
MNLPGGRHRKGHRPAPPGKVVYGAVFREGEHELERSNRVLASSRLAAGVQAEFFLSEEKPGRHNPLSERYYVSCHSRKSA